MKISKKPNIILAWLLCLFCIILPSATTIIWLQDLGRPPTLPEAGDAFGFPLALPILFSVVAALIVARQPDNRVGWLLMLPALAAAINLDPYLAAAPESLTPGLWLLLWYDNWSWIPIIFPIFLIPLHFPSGRPPSPNWRWVNWLAWGMWFFFVLVTPFLEGIGPLDEAWTLPNPIGFLPADTLDGTFLIVWGLGLVTVVSASVVALFVRFRQAQVVERQQIKWLLYAGAMFVFVYTIVYFQADADEPWAISSWLNLLFTLSILSFPVTIAIAILRYRLFDIDVIIRKTAVYAVLSALLALVYFGSVVLLQTVFDAVTQARSPVIIVVSTLMIAALFAPLRRRVQAFIDRRFFRKTFDAQQVLAKFAQTARDEVSLTALTRELTHVVQETMQPEHVTLWLKE